MRRAGKLNGSFGEPIKAESIHYPRNENLRVPFIKTTPRFLQGPGRGQVNQCHFMSPARFTGEETPAERGRVVHKVPVGQPLVMEDEGFYCSRFASSGDTAARSG